MLLEVYVKNITRQCIKNTSELLNEFADLLKIKYPQPYYISVLYCGDSTMKNLNSLYRKKDKTTDVLSFPAETPYMLGDIIISIPQAKKQSVDGLQNEMETLLCHGFLHLLGYDHEINEKEYNRMMNLQASLMTKKIQRLSLT